MTVTDINLYAIFFILFLKKHLFWVEKPLKQGIVNNTVFFYNLDRLLFLIISTKDERCNGLWLFIGKLPKMVVMLFLC